MKTLTLFYIPYLTLDLLFSKKISILQRDIFLQNGYLKSQLILKILHHMRLYELRTILIKHKK